MTFFFSGCCCDGGIFALWDISLPRDGRPDPNPVANFLNDPSGTFQADQLYFEEDRQTPILAGNVTMTISSQPDGAGTLFGTFTGVFGDSFSDSTKWVSVYSIWNYFDGDIVGFQEGINFAKITFADDFGLTNSQATTLYFCLQIQVGTSVSNNAFRCLIVPQFVQDGAYVSPEYLNIIADRFWVSEFTSEGASVTGLSEGAFSFAYTKRNATDLIVAPNNLRFSTRTKIDTIEDPLGVLYFAGEGRTIWRMAPSGVDSDGLITYNNKELVFPVVHNFPQIALALLDDRFNGRPAILVSKPGFGLYVLKWDGLAWNSTTLSGGVFADIRTFEGDFLNIPNDGVYIAGKSILGEFSGVRQYKYSGDITDPNNWTSQDIVVNNATPNDPFDGTGATGSVGGGTHIFADNLDFSGGYPSIYVTNRLHHIIQRVRKDPNRNTGTESDFDVTTIIGLLDTPANTDGIGTAARVDTPKGITRAPDGNIYFAQSSPAHNVRLFDPITLQTGQFKGQYGISSKTNYIQY